MNKKRAERLWEQLKQHLINAERVLEEIIAEKAWEPLGYNTFTEAWAAHNMSDITLASELRPHVIYQMLDEDQTVEDIADTVKGVGPEQVKLTARQRKHGVPAGKAVLVRSHSRDMPSEPYRIVVEVDAATYRGYEKIAADYGSTVKTIAGEAITERFNTLLALESQRIR